MRQIPSDERRRQQAKVVHSSQCLRSITAGSVFLNPLFEGYAAAQLVDLFLAFSKARDNIA